MLKESLLLSILLVSVSGCASITPGKASLDRAKAKELLEPQLNLDRQESSYVCGIDTSLAGKPEFSPLQGKDFCDTTLEVTGIREEGEGKATADYKVVTSFASGYLEDYSKGIDAFKSRLLSLPGVFDPSAAAIGRSGVINYTDPTDGGIYSVNVVLGNSTAIDRTAAWRGLTELQGRLNSQISNGPSSVEGSATFALYDDGWRVTNPL